MTVTDHELVARMKAAPMFDAGSDDWFLRVGRSVERLLLSKLRLHVVYSPCDCDDPSCYGKTDIKLFVSKQTAEQEADLRTKRYGGHAGRPELHMETIALSHKTSGF